jgi:hypothetical protein
MSYMFYHFIGDVICRIVFCHAISYGYLCCVVLPVMFHLNTSHHIKEYHHHDRHPIIIFDDVSELLDEVMTVTGEDSIATAREIAIKEVRYVMICSAVLCCVVLCCVVL